jgi:hypothetical protein
MTADLPVRKSYVLDILDGQHTLRTVTIPGAGSELSGVITARKPFHNKTVLPAGEGTSAGFDLKLVSGGAL